MGMSMFGKPPGWKPPPEYPRGIPRDVCDLFERFTFDLINRGWDRYSSDAILHRIRWHHHVDRGDREFKCNDHWTSTLSRWFMGKYPSNDGFFETRVLRARGRNGSEE
jgi:hypothetical protein